MDFQLRKHWTIFALPIMHTHLYRYHRTISTNTSFLLTLPPFHFFLNGRVDNQDDISAIPVLTWVITID